ncbi:MAG: hypothetical protein QOC73_925 [Actinomycetota bacterium]|nr:hypothetical protein [Actinomycetota bacterium]
MDDLQILGGRSRGSMIRLVRAGVGLFGGGFVAGVVVALVFHALLVTLIVFAAIVVLAVAAAKMMIGRRRY